MSRSFRACAAAFAATFFTVAASAATLTLGDASLSGDQLTVPVTVSGAAAGDLKLYIGEAGPRDGEPTATASAATLAIAGDGSYNLTAQISVGAKIAYKAVLGSDESASGSITATDTSEYIWVNNATGLWSNPDNWTRKNTATDNYKNIGYPAYSTGIIRFLGDQTAEVTLDADYSGFGDFFIDNRRLNLTIHGNGHVLKTGNTHTTGDNTFVFDNVRYTTTGSYTVESRSSAQLINGTYFQTQWEFNVNGSGSAYLYVGPGCEINCGVGDTNAYTFRLDGEGNSIVIDDAYVHTRGLRIAQNRDGVPNGIVFKGSNPRLECYREFVVCKSLSGNPVLEFYVPIGGYAQPPIRKTLSGDYIALGNKWINHTSSTSVYSPIAFKISEKSPFYQSESETDVCLFDWSASTAGIRDGSLVFLNDYATTPSDYIYAKKANSECATSQDQVWAHLTGTATPADLPTPSTSASATADSTTATIAVSGTIDTFTSSDYAACLELWVAELGPKDDPATATFTKASDTAVTAAGSVTLNYVGMLGAQIAYKLVLTASKDTKTWECGATEVQTIVLSESNSVSYAWISGKDGLWSDAANWTRSGGDEALRHRGYPTWGASAVFSGASDVVRVDADYARIASVSFGGAGATVTFVSSTAGVSHTVETEDNFDCAQNSNIVLDGVVFGTLGNTYPARCRVYGGATLEMRNGAGVRTRWESQVSGENARIYVGTNSFLEVSMSESWHRLEISGSNAEIVIDDGVVDALQLTIGNDYTGDTPKGVTFKGKAPQLRLRDDNGQRASAVVNAIPGSPAFSFVIPAGGYARTPVVRTGNGGNTFFAQSSSSIPPLMFKVDKTSPYRKVRGDFTQQLLDWSTSAAESKINTAGVTLAASDRAGETLYFTPVEGDAKSGVSIDCIGQKSFAVVVR